jgi:hypothetical protein
MRMVLPLRGAGLGDAGLAPRARGLVPFMADIAAAALPATKQSGNTGTQTRVSHMAQLGARVAHPSACLSFVLALQCIQGR